MMMNRRGGEGRGRAPLGRGGEDKANSRKRRPHASGSVTTVTQPEAYATSFARELHSVARNVPAGAEHEHASRGWEKGHAKGGSHRRQANQNPHKPRLGGRLRRHQDGELANERTAWVHEGEERGGPRDGTRTSGTPEVGGTGVRGKPRKTETTSKSNESRRNDRDTRENTQGGRANRGNRHAREEWSTRGRRTNRGNRHESTRRRRRRRGVDRRGSGGRRRRRGRGRAGGRAGGATGRARATGGKAKDFTRRHLGVGLSQDARRRRRRLTPQMHVRLHARRLTPRSTLPCRDQDQGPGSRNRDHAGTPRARVLVYTHTRGGLKKHQSHPFLLHPPACA